MAKQHCQAERDRLERAVSMLRPIEREVLILSAREGLRNEEIVLRLGITVDAAQRHLADSLYGLAHRLEHLERPWWKIW